MGRKKDKKIFCCSVCGKYFEDVPSKKRLYCSTICYVKDYKGKPKSEETKKNMSVAQTGKPKPWQRGENNPNFGGKYTHDPEIYERMSKARKKVGSAWTEENKKEHSLRMLGPSNKMRGTHHTEETKKLVSEIRSKQYRDGIVKLNLSSISKAEKEIYRISELTADKI